MNAAAPVRRTRRPGGLAGQPWAWAALLAAAFVARVVVAFHVPPPASGDPLEYIAVGQDLAMHGTYGLQTLRAPGYPTLIAAVYAVCGPNLLALRLVECVLGTASVALLGWIGARWFGPREGFLAAVLLALHPVAVYLPSSQYCENTAVLLVVAAVALLYRGLSRPGAWPWALLGAVLAAEVLVRPNSIALLPGLALGAVVLLARARRAWALPVVLTGAVFVAGLAPWTIRNAVHHHHVYFVSTGGGRSLWLGNHAGAEADPSAVQFIDSTTAAARDREPDLVLRDRFLTRRALEWMRAHPDLAARNFVREVGNLFALWPRPIGNVHMNPRRAAAQGAASAVVFAGAALALAGLRRRPLLWPLVLGAATYTLATALVLTVLRYRLVIEPFLLLMAGIGWARFWPRPPHPVVAPVQERDDG